MRLLKKTRRRHREQQTHARMDRLVERLIGPLQSPAPKTAWGHMVERVGGGFAVYAVAGQDEGGRLLRRFLAWYPTEADADALALLDPLTRDEIDQAWRSR